MKLALRDTYRQPGIRGGVGYYTIWLAQELNRIVDTLHVYTGEPEAFPGCKTLQDSTVYNGKVLRRRFKRMKDIIRPSLLPKDYSCVIFPHPFEPLVDAPNSKRIVVVHDLIPLKKLDGSFRYYQRYIYYKYFLGHMFRSVDKIVAISASTKKDLIQYFGLPESKIEVIFNGFNHLLSSANLREDLDDGSHYGGYGNYVLYIGNLLPHKNLERLIQAIALIREQMDVNLVLVGSSDSKKYKKIAKRLGIHNHVFFLGNIPDGQLSGIIQKAKAFVLPSLYEGFGMPPLEAMSASVPVAVSRTSSLPEVCGDAALYFNPYDILDIANTIKKLLNDQQVRQRCIANGLEQIRLFDWNITAQNFVEMILSL